MSSRSSESMESGAGRSRVRRTSLVVAGAGLVTAAVLVAAGTGLAGQGPGFGVAAATAEDTVGVSEGGIGGGETTGGEVGGADAGADGGGTVGVTSGGTSGETVSGSGSGGAAGGSSPTPTPVPSPSGPGGGAVSGGVIGGPSTGPTDPPVPTDEPTPEPTAQPSPGPQPPSGQSCWSWTDNRPVNGTFLALVPAGTLPTGNKATLVELRFTAKAVGDSWVDDRIVTRFAATGGAWSTARPVPVELRQDGLETFRPVVDGLALKMPEITVNSVDCWNTTVTGLGGYLTYGGPGGNGGVEVRVPVTWQRQR
ncbi:hypothetical protein [Streptomyces sp. NPDC090025]|uniref:hypothetical protein n=1 Tax=Streptomyces sp. NPDC090025 TaxID=3365922 RepID=UPI003838D991